MTRNERLAVLRRIVSTQTFSGQDELRVRLATEGIFLSQPQLSRDLIAVHATKRNGRYVIVEDERYRRVY